MLKVMPSQIPALLQTVKHVFNNVETARQKMVSFNLKMHILDTLNVPKSYALCFKSQFKLHRCNSYEKEREGKKKIQARFLEYGQFFTRERKHVEIQKSILMQ